MKKITLSSFPFFTQHKNTHKKQKLLLLSFVVVFCFIFYAVFIPKILLGDFFFGRSKYFYSLPMATFFYKQALFFDSKKGIPPPDLYYQLGRVAFIEGKLEKAVPLFDKELFFYPKHVKSYYMKGLTLAYEGKYHAAIGSFEEYNEKQPVGWAGKNDEAWLLYTVGDLKKALTVIEKAYQDGYINPWVMNTYGVILLNLGKCDGAQTVLDTAYRNSLTMKEDSWGASYPGNDPRVYAEGLKQMRDSLKENLRLSKTSCINNVEN